MSVKMVGSDRVDRAGSRGYMPNSRCNSGANKITPEQGDSEGQRFRFLTISASLTLGLHPHLLVYRSKSRWMSFQSFSVTSLKGEGAAEGEDELKSSPGVADDDEEKCGES